MHHKSKIHRNFQFQSQVFLSATDLISHVDEVSKDSAIFLKAWFDASPTVEVQTSGSTGTPKKIVLQKEFMRNSAVATGAHFGLASKTTALLCMSSKYIAGKMMWVRALELGWHLDLVTVSSNPMDGLQKNYDFVAMVPLQLWNSIEKLHQIDTLIVGGGVVAQSLKAKLQALSTKVYATYGMTETITHIAVQPLNHVAHNNTGFYKVLPGVVIDTDARGCLVIDAPSLSDVPVVTNDLVRIVDNENFEWLGRYDSIINSGGVKLIPEQIETKLATTYSGTFFIHALEDAVFGQKAVLVVEGEGNPIHNKQAILAFLANPVLEVYEVPKSIYFVKDFVYTETKKIQRTKTIARCIF
ncbi:MAG: AMP-binding protein [Flavicella sp.]